MPSVRFFWKIRKMTRIGMMERVDMANMAPQSDWAEGSENIFRAMDRVYLEGEFRYSRAPKKSSQRHMKEKMEVVMMDGLISGRMIHRKMP